MIHGNHAGPEVESHATLAKGARCKRRVMPSRDATTEDVERDSLGALQQRPSCPAGDGMENASWRYAHLLQPADQLWGPISDEEAAKCGAPAGCASDALAAVGG